MSLLLNKDNKLRKFIIDYLKAHQSKVTEYQLLTHIEKERPRFFDCCSQKPCLFKKHFKLFNLLYTMDEQLAHEGLKLNISALDISLIPTDSSTTQIGNHDDLREFYMDCKNFELSESEISEMLASFWRKMVAGQDLSQYLEVLQIRESDKLDRKLVKRQFNKLAFEMHPDQGGCATKFSELHNAYQQVILTLG